MTESELKAGVQRVAARVREQDTAQMSWEGVCRLLIREGIREGYAMASQECFVAMAADQRNRGAAE